jgi:hypothetical protein
VLIEISTIFLCFFFKGVSRVVLAFWSSVALGVCFSYNPGLSFVSYGCLHCCFFSSQLYIPSAERITSAGLFEKWTLLNGLFDDPEINYFSTHVINVARHHFNVAVPGFSSEDHGFPAMILVGIVSEPKIRHYWKYISYAGVIWPLFIIKHQYLIGVWLGEDQRTNTHV